MTEKDKFERLKKHIKPAELRELKKLWEQFDNHLLNEQLTARRRAKLFQMFLTTAKGLKKTYRAAEREDIERFLNALNRNSITRDDGKPYSGSSKADIKKFLRQFYKWLEGDNEFYPKKVSWIKARIGKDEQPERKPVITAKQAMKLANSFEKLSYKALTLLLFDSGFRIQEALTMKKKHLSWERYGETGDECFWAFCPTSKTQRRKIPIPLFTEELQAFTNSAYCRGLEDDELLFDISYSNYRHLLIQHSKKLFNKELSPHALRHSSATMYAVELDGNAMQLAQRYGWAFNSKELQTYIRESGSYERVTAKKVFENEVISLKKENAELRTLLSGLSLSLGLLKKDMEQLKKSKK